MIVTASVAMSLDGYIDDLSPDRLILSSQEDWDAVHRLRGECDAILVGAGTLKADNPSLVIRDEQLRRQRVARGQSPDILRVAVTRTGRLDTSLRFFTGPGRPILFVESHSDALSQVADLEIAPSIDARLIIDRLSSRGVRSLMVEGGAQMLTMFLSQGAVDRLRVAIAPFFVGQAGAPRLVLPALFGADSRMVPQGTEILGDTTVIHFVKKR